VVSDEATILTQVPSEKSHLKENANQPQEIDSASKFVVPSNGVFSMFWNYIEFSWFSSLQLHWGKQDLAAQDLEHSEIHSSAYG